MPVKIPKKKKLVIVDLFCGAGGTTTGAVEAARALGYEVEVTVVNHNPDSIATHKLNHPEAIHLCTGVDDVEPRSLYQRGEVGILLASPECTNHSKAKGGKPRDDQSRSSGWCICKWAEQVQPAYIMIENVAEFLDWGPLIKKRVKRKFKRWLKAGEKMKRGEELVATNGKGRRQVMMEKAVWEWHPDPKRKGETFQAWAAILRTLGYRLEYRRQVSANFGDPTTRERLIILCVLGRKKVVWPNHTHAPLNAESRVIDPALRAWVPAAEIIDWSLEGKSIYDRDRPLSPKTMARIMAGLKKFGGPFLVPQFGERPGQTPRTHAVTEPFPAVTSHGAGAVVEPIILPQNSSNEARPVSRPCPVVTTTSRGIGLAYVVAWDNQSSGSGGGIASVYQPLSSVVTKARHGVAEAVYHELDPFMVDLRGGTEGHFWRSARPLTETLSTVTANGNHHGWCVPFLVRYQGDHADRDNSHHLAEPKLEPFLVKCANGLSWCGEENRVKGLHETAPTITCSNDLALVSFLIKTANGGEAADSRVKSLDDTPPTICGNRGDLAKIDAFIMSAGGPVCAAKPVSQPVGAILTRDHRALVEPVLNPAFLLGQQSGAALRPTSEPAPAVATAGAIALVETEFRPFIVTYYGTGQALPIEDPLDTVTCVDRFGLVRPVVMIEGKRYQLDILFRMLQPHELALAQGFRPDYQFAGNKSVTVQQIGNAVTRRLARAHVAALLSQDADVMWLIEAEEAGEREAAA